MVKTTAQPATGYQDFLVLIHDGGTGTIKGLAKAIPISDDIEAQMGTPSI